MADYDCDFCNKSKRCKRYYNSRDCVYDVVEEGFEHKELLSKSKEQIQLVLDDLNKQTDEDDFMYIKSLLNNLINELNESTDEELIKEYKDLNNKDLV